MTKESASAVSCCPSFVIRYSLFVIRYSLLLRPALRQRPVILFDQRLEFRRDFFVAADQRAIRFLADLAPQSVFEAFEAFGDKRLQARQLFDVLVDALGIQLAQPAHDL